MIKKEAEEAAGIVYRILDQLLLTASDHGLPGSELRNECGKLRAHTLDYLRDYSLGEPLAYCFDLALEAGASLRQMGDIRVKILNEKPVWLPAILVMQSAALICLSAESQIISSINFVSRNDIEVVKANMNEAFAVAQETAADYMDAAAFQALIALQAAVTQYLVSEARPLPRIVMYAFARPSMSTLYMAYRLYSDAGRANELRYENQVIHPAFAQPRGLALSA